MIKKILDCGKLDCPKPLLEVKEILETSHFDQLEITVDNLAAKENILRFLKSQGLQNTSFSEDKEKKEFLINVSNGNNIPFNINRPISNNSNNLNHSQTEAILISNDTIGQGNRELGELLLKGFIYALSEQDKAPHYLIFMNSGVTKCCTDSNNLEDLNKLKEKGCKILVCGTCLDYLHLQESLQIGTISNMYEIVQVLTEHSSFTI